VINGGRRCVDSKGVEPPGWQLNGTHLDLATCARIASRQPHVVGFRWGKRGFNHSAYMRHVRPSKSEGISTHEASVDLSQLFSGTGSFKCTIYMVDRNGGAPALDLDDAELPVHARSRRLFTHQFPREDHRRYAQHGVGGARFLRQYGDEVCLQRRSLLRYYNFETTEMWFCYSPEDRWSGCDAKIKAFYLESLLPMLGALALIFLLSYIVQNQWHFTWALLWVASFCVNLELGVASVALLLTIGADGKMGTLTFEAAAFFLVVVGASLALLPHRCCGLQRWCPVLATSYLLVLVSLPCITLDLMTYWNAFPLLVDHWPVLLGLLGFAIDLLKCCFFYEATETPMTGMFSARSSLKVKPGDYEYVGMRLAAEGFVP